MKLLIPSLLIATLTLNSFAQDNVSSEESKGTFKNDPRRGSPSEYDPGPDKNSKWIELFGSVPNYRAIGKLVIDGDEFSSGNEKFRWQFGPMWYRGRLQPNKVKAFVVGQEGAQDENISNRAFTGSTGTKTQKFLNHLGIRESYLFLNTFVYTINGQLADDPRFKWLEQNTDSPIVEYRHKLFDNMAETNPDSLQLIMGVGSGGKASVATWINARGGKCSVYNELQNCETEGLRAWFKQNRNIELKHKILAVGVPHPGGANPNLGGEEQLQNIILGFTNAAKKVAAFKDQNPEWLITDDEEYAQTPDQKLEARNKLMDRLKQEYKYGNAPVPFKDFAFGTNWRMGASGTSSNRWGADSIQIFSKEIPEVEKNNPDYEGNYGTKKSKYPSVYDNKQFKLVSNSSGVKQIIGMASQDVPYEPPKYYPENPDHAKQFDYGPCGETPVQSCKMSQLLQTWPDFYNNQTIAPINKPDLGHGPIYRGRLQDAKVLILADQFSHDDMFSARALTGEMGQRLQGWLNSLGAGSSYAIIRTLPVDTLGQNPKLTLKLALRPDVMQSRSNIISEILSFNKTKVVIVLGSVAEKVADKMKLEDKVDDLFALDVPEKNDDGYLSNWNKVAKKVSKVLGLSEPEKFMGELVAIPRIDLPVHSRWWMGTSGSRAARGVYSDGSEGIFYRVYAPVWSTYQKPMRLSKDLKESIIEKLSKQSFDELPTEDEEIPDQQLDTESKVLQEYLKSIAP